MMKKFRLVAILIVFSMTLCSCKSGKEPVSPASTFSSTESTVSTESLVSTESSVSTETSASVEVSVSASTETSVEVSIPVDNTPIEISEDCTSVEFAKALKLGWNLGNTLDALGKSGVDSEKAWGQPLTTPEIIQFVKASGFTTIRIPVTWGQHTSGDNYEIMPEWMDRVEEVVNYALDANLYVIINSHHDNSYYYPSEENLDNALKYVECVWAQVAERFKDYDERLIFESLNEPRLEGTAIEWWFPENDPEGIACIKRINQLNQVFVDTVRAAGGYNESRFLLVPSAMASPENALNSNFVVPTDPAERIMISIHAYTPYDFTMNKNGYDRWTDDRKGELNFLSSLNLGFIKKGYGVVITEMGATNKDNLKERVKWAKEYTRKADAFGISCIWWDNGGTAVGEENFGLLNRRNLTVSFPEILECMTNNYNN